MDEARLRALVIDDEPNIRSTLALCLESIGCEVHASAGAREAMAVLERRPFDLAFLDLRLGQADGMELLPEILRVSPRMAVVVITAYASIESAVQAMRRGAQDYLPKPFTPAQVRLIVDRLYKRLSLESASESATLWLVGEVVPEIEKAERIAPAFDVITVQAVSLLGEDPLDISHLSFGAARAFRPLELGHDNVLGRRNPQFGPENDSSPASPELCVAERTVLPHDEVGLPPAGQVDHVELAPLTDCLASGTLIDIVRVGIEAREQRAQVARRQLHDEVQVLRRPGSTVERARHRPGQHVVDIRLPEERYEALEKRPQVCHEGSSGLSGQAARYSSSPRTRRSIAFRASSWEYSGCRVRMPSIAISRTRSLRSMATAIRPCGPNRRQASSCARAAAASVSDILFMPRV